MKKIWIIFILIVSLFSCTNWKQDIKIEDKKINIYPWPIQIPEIKNQPNL